jgi:hypothetical protein
MMAYSRPRTRHPRNAIGYVHKSRMEVRVAPAPLVFAARRSYIGFAMSSVPPLPLPTEGAADRLTEAAARAERDMERVVLIRDGNPVAAVVPIEDLEADPDAAA